MKLVPSSTEQQLIVESTRKKNIVVDSVAGSGKTTTCLHIATHFRKLNILLLTYNARLKAETREKASALNLDNLEVHSFHSFCVKYYDSECFTDTTIRKILNPHESVARQKPFCFDLFILDEVQDMTGLYYELVCRIYRDNDNPSATFCLFGDVKQSIFDFNHADFRFMKYASDLFHFHTKRTPWVECRLSKSFRVTQPMARFINICLLRENRIVSDKRSTRLPRYIICDVFGDRLGTSSRAFQEIQHYLEMGYKPKDFFILAPSVKTPNSPVRQLENKIKRELPKVLVHVPTNDEEKLDSEIIKGKMVFSTFHQVKGLERKVVVVFNFDASYFSFYKRHSNPRVFPNELYVAVTRASEQLSVFHHYQNDFLECVSREHIPMYCDYEEHAPLELKKNRFMNKNTKTAATDLFRHLPQKVIDDCFDFLTIVRDDRYKCSRISIPLKISNHECDQEIVENVSEITGIAVPSRYELLLHGKMSILERLKQEESEQHITTEDGSVSTKSRRLLSKPPRDPPRTYHLSRINPLDIKVEEVLCIANHWNSFKTGYLFKLYQINRYDWLTPETMEACLARIKSIGISKTSVFEHQLVAENQTELFDRKLVGFVDCIDNFHHVLYELKCTQTIKKEHCLQLMVYAYMHGLNTHTNDATKPMFRNVLFNILTNEYLEIRCEFSKLKMMVGHLIHAKYFDRRVVSDIEFVQIHQRIKNRYFQ